MITLQNYSVKVRDGKARKTILSDINLKFKPGHIYAVMGPNGSGKSTLAKSIMGDPSLLLSSASKLSFSDTSSNKKGRSINLKNLEADERAGKGIFLSMQSPLEIPGVTVFGLLRAATKDKLFDGKKIRAIELKKKIDEYAKELHITPELLERSLNQDLSGGERKKIEVLQMAILNPDYILLDEIDTGVDVDALKVIATFLKKFIRKTDKTIIMITHYNRILKHLKPDTTIVIKSGKIAKKGTADLAKQIEISGFEKI